MVIGNGTLRVCRVLWAFRLLVEGILDGRRFYTPLLFKLILSLILNPKPQDACKDLKTGLPDPADVWV